MLTTPAIAANTAPMCGIVILTGSHLVVRTKTHLKLNILYVQTGRIETMKVDRFLKNNLKRIYCHYTDNRTF